MLSSHIQAFVSAAFLLASSGSATAHPFFPSVRATSPNNSVSPPTLVHLFTVQLSLGSALMPITIPAGIRDVEPIMNGTITGPGLNATITGGVAYPSFIYDQTFQIPEINAWGTTDDGEPFFVKESGIGLLSKQISRIEVEIGGNYTDFATSFIIGVISPNIANASVTVEAWNVTAPK